MPTGQPGTQRGFLQRRQRSASCSAPSRSRPSATSSKLWTRSSGGWCGMGARSGGMVLMFLGTQRPGRRRASASGSSHVEPQRRHASMAGLRCSASLADSLRKRSSAAFSSRSKRFWRSASSSKLTRWPSKSAPSTQANFILPPTVTRQDPHMPVPSTMIEFRLTTVGMPNGRVTSQHAFIIGMGPMATTSRTFCFAARTSASACGHEALAAVAAVVGGDDQLVAALRGTGPPRRRGRWLRKPTMEMVRLPCFLYSRSCGIDRRDAEAAADQHDRAVQVADVAGQPERADEIEDRRRLRGSAIISKVVLPTAWMTTVTVPRSRVEICNGQRDAFAMLVDASHDEVSGPRRPRHIRRVHVPEEGAGAELLPAKDLIQSGSAS